MNFEVAGDITPPDGCHCAQCRKWSGHFFASADIPREALTVQGEVTWFHSSEKVRRGFCPTCGSSLFFDPIDRVKNDWIGVAMGLYSGLNYSMSIHRGAFDAEQSKSTWAIIDEAGSVILEEDDVVMYQRSGDSGSVLFAASVVGEEAYTCGSVATAFPFTRNQVDQMVESCRSLAASGS